MTHDYKRNGTTTLFAALNPLDGKDHFLEAWNAKPKPFVWTATVEEIIKKIELARAKLEQIKPGSTLPRGKKTSAGT